VLIADDQLLVRRGFRLILEIEPDLEIVGEASGGAEAVSMCREIRPDVVLMDVRMPGVDGIAAAAQVTADDRCEGTKVVMLTTFDMDEYVYDALRAGASGFLLKDVPPELLVAGIRAVHAGDALLAPAVTRRMISSFLGVDRRPAAAAPPELELLTVREREVLELLARGLSNAEIAAELVVSETTVKTHVAHILAKLGLRDRVHAVIFSYRNGVLADDDGASAPERSCPR
jgi:DNA-binding NarL/FixJ family response regulator